MYTTTQPISLEEATQQAKEQATEEPTLTISYTNENGERITVQGTNVEVK